MSRNVFLALFDALLVDQHFFNIFNYYKKNLMSPNVAQHPLMFHSNYLVFFNIFLMLYDFPIIPLLPKEK
jgi:hypothetical protein